MVKLKFVLMLLVLALIGFGGWGYTAYQLQVVQNNHTEVVAENAEIVAELQKIHAQQQDDRRSWEEFNAAAQAQHEKVFGKPSSTPDSTAGYTEADYEKYSLMGMIERRQQQREQQNQEKD